MIQPMPNPLPDEPFRLKPSHIEQYAVGLEQIEMIDGRKVYVDQTGLVVCGRRYAINSSPPEEQIKIAVAWCEQAHRIKGTNVCSYSAKHVAETLAKSYISNGAMLLAASRTGIRIAVENRFYWQSPNALFGISLRWYRRQRQAAYGEGAL